MLMSDRRIDVSLIPRYLEYLIQIGVTGAYFHGTTGEGVSIPHEEKKRLTRAWVEARRQLSSGNSTTARAAASFLLIPNVSSCVTADALDHARLCNELAVDAIATLPPFYYRPATPAILTQYLASIAAAAEQTPLLYYHFPEMTHVDFPVREVVDLAIQRIPSFAGLKYTSRDVIQLANLEREFGKRVKVFVGYEESMLSAAANGVNSGICAQFSFRSCVEDFKVIMEKHGSNVEAAREAQARLTQVAHSLASGAGDGSRSFIGNVKRRLASESGLPVGPPLSPILEGK